MKSNGNIETKTPPINKKTSKKASLTDKCSKENLKLDILKIRKEKEELERDVLLLTRSEKRLDIIKKKMELRKYAVENDFIYESESE